MLIEANPLHASILKETFAGDRHVTVLATAVGDRIGAADLLVHTSRSGSTESASLLRLQALQEIVPTLTTSRAVRVPMTTLDELVRQPSLGLDRYNLLVVDVQGAEQLVFQGASLFIAQCDAIVTEVNLVPLYEGAPLEEELLDHLRAKGFEPRQSVYHELYRHEDRFLAWGECLLLRNGQEADQARSRTATPIPVRP
jgi:FkbM family methyltransferase